MAVVTAAEEAAHFRRLADAENLESTIVAEVCGEPRMVMVLDGHEIVNISRAFLNSNGAEKHTEVLVPDVKEKEAMHISSVKEGMLSLAQDLNICSLKGLSERFDSTIGSGTVLMPFGGKNQLTPSQTMAAKLPVLKGDTDTVSLMSWGFDPYESERSPFHASQEAVIASIAKIICAGGTRSKAWMSFQEYFGKPGTDPAKWGRPFAALLGALRAQRELEVAAIGGKDSMSGTFEDIDVPPTLISFAVSLSDLDHVVSDEWKKAGNSIYLLKPEYDENGLPDYGSVRKILDTVEEWNNAKMIRSAYTLERGGLAEGLLKCALGNGLGFSALKDMDAEELFGRCYGAVMLESDQELPAVKIGVTAEKPEFVINGETISLKELRDVYEAKLKSVYPYYSEEKETYEKADWQERGIIHASYTCEKPRVLIPVFPGTNCEYDTARAFEKAGAEAEIFVIRNLTSADIEDSAERFEAAIRKSQIIAIPGGFSGGDEPDGSGKFITAFFRNPRIRVAVRELLDEREGLMLGICNGFQALIKLGLVPYGKIIDTDENCPTLTYNTIGRHQSMLVQTRVSSVKSPWLRYCEPGEIHTVAISHGEGRFIASEEVMKQLLENGQVAFQYVDQDGNPTSDLRFNPNDSVMAVEGITSPDGRILGKMGHSERSGKGLYQNIPDPFTEEMLFKAAVDYFR